MPCEFIGNCDATLWRWDKEGGNGPEDRHLMPSGISHSSHIEIPYTFPPPSSAHPSPHRAKPDEDRYMNEKAAYRAPDQGRRKRGRTGYNVFFSEYVYRLKTRDDMGMPPPERGTTARIVGQAWKKMSAIEKERYEREACGLYGDSDHVGTSGGGGGGGGGHPRYLHYPPSRLGPLALEGGEQHASLVVGGESTMAPTSARDDDGDELHSPDANDGAQHHPHPPEGLDPNGMLYPPPLQPASPPGGHPPAIMHQAGEGAYDPYAYGPGMMLPPPNPYDHMFGGYPPPYAIPPPGMLMPPMYGLPPKYHLPPPPPHHHLPCNPTYDVGG